MTNKLSDGVVHRIPNDVQKAFMTSRGSQTAWEDITPLARNEWICWIESAKKPETRSHRIERTRAELIDGKRRANQKPKIIEKVSNTELRILSPT